LFIERFISEGYALLFIMVVLILIATGLDVIRRGVPLSHLFFPLSLNSGRRLIDGVNY